MVTKIHIRKERLKFSSAHMTVFEDGTKEHLHGHNYETELTVESKSVIPFSLFKKSLEKVTSFWDEKLLLAANCKHFKEMKGSKESFSFSLCGKTYSIPKDEIVLLETDNITSESLSQIALESFLKALPSKAKSQLKSVTLRIDESRGQGASTTWSSK